MRFDGPQGIVPKSKIFFVPITEGGGAGDVKPRDQNTGINGNAAWGDIGDKPKFSTKTTLKAVHSMTPDEAKAKFADAKMETYFDGSGYGIQRNPKGQIANRVYTDNAGNVKIFIEYSYNPDGSVKDTKQYNLQGNGEYRLKNYTEYNEKEGYAIEQGYFNNGKPYSGCVVYKVGKDANGDPVITSHSDKSKAKKIFEEAINTRFGDKAPILE